MVAKKQTAQDGGIKVTNDGRLQVNEAKVDDGRHNDGGPGPDSSLKTGEGSGNGASAGAQAPEGPVSKGVAYDVQIHTDEDGLQVVRINAESGDAAAADALKQKNFRGASVRGVTPASDPDPNSLGGERDASIMYSNAENGGAAINPLGTEANREATEKLGRKDVSELGE